MAKYKCDICGYIYDEDREEIPYDLLWFCPLCKSQRTTLVPISDEEAGNIDENPANRSLHQSAESVLE